MKHDEEGQTNLTLVEAAARSAASHALTSPEGKARQRKLIIISCLCSLLVMLCVALPASYFLDRDRQSSSVQRSRFNCDLQTEAAQIQRDILQIGTDLRRDNRELNKDPRVAKALLDIFGADLVKNLYAKTARNEQRAIDRWDVKLAQLRRLARVDCDDVIVNSGVKKAPAIGPTGPTGPTLGR